MGREPTCETPATRVEMRVEFLLIVEMAHDLRFVATVLPKLIGEHFADFRFHIRQSFFLILGIQEHGNSQEGRDKEDLIRDLLAAVKNAETFQFRLKDYERIKGVLEIGDEDVKISLQPLELYFYVHKPDKGVEILWVEGQNNGNAWVHPNSFPYFTLNLNPYGSMMRGGHHVMFDLNFNYLTGIIQTTQSKLGTKFFENVVDLGKINFNGRLCQQICIEYTGFGLHTYRVRSGENMESIAKANHLSEYLILEKNPGLKHYGDIRPNQQIYIPNNYFEKLILYIDEESSFPLVEMFFDEHGLFEKYEFYNLKVNVSFAKVDFSKNNPAYHF